MMRPTTPAVGPATFFDLGQSIFHATVRELQKPHADLGLGLLMSLAQNLILIGVSLATSSMMGSAGIGLRGDKLIVLITGIFLYMVHSKAMSAVLSADGPHTASGRMIPMPPIICMFGAALASLILQALSAAIILFVYHSLWTPFVIEDAPGLALMFLLAWASGFAVGCVIAALRPWSPEIMTLVSQFYSRASMVLSGSMFMAASLPPAILPWFTWNPLFNITDQARGDAFINYVPHLSSASFCVTSTLGLLTLGIAAEFHSRRASSLSRYAS